MDIENSHVVAAITGCCRLWDFYPTRELAEAHLGRPSGEGPWQVMTFQEFKAAERKNILSGKLVEITGEEYDDAFEVLPPQQYEGIPGGGERFLMLEHLTGPYTSQYARFGTRYFTKVVDATDRSTWLTREQCLGEQPA